MRLIDADALLQNIRRAVYTDDLTTTIAVGICESHVKDMPTVDAEPVKHGRWVMDEYPHDGDVRCSVCRIAIAQMHERYHKLLNALTGGKWYTFYSYCPRCGAKMDLEEVGDGKAD